MHFSRLPFKGVDTYEQVANHYSTVHRIFGILFAETWKIKPIPHLDILRKYSLGVYSGTTTLSFEIQEKLGGIASIITTHRRNYAKFKNGTKMIEFSCKKLYSYNFRGKRSVLRRGQRVGIAMAKDKSRCISIVGIFDVFLGPFTTSNSKKVHF